MSNSARHKVALFLGRHETPASGMWVYSRALIRGLLKTESDTDFSCVYGGGEQIARDIQDLEKDSTEGNFRSYSLPKYLGFRRLGQFLDMLLPGTGLNNVDLVHGTSNLIPLRARGRSIVTLHDLLQALSLIHI